METIREHIKQNSFVHVYLLYGEEQQVVKIYRNKLLKALTGTDSLEKLKQDMNFSLFVGTPLDTSAVIEMASSYPFLAERRVILIENSKAFSQGNAALADCIRNLPETTYIIFTEEKISGKKGGNSNNEDDENLKEESDNNDTASANNAEGKKSGSKALLSAVKEVGYATEINKQSQKDVEDWVIREFSTAGKRVSRIALDLLLTRTDMDMMRLRNEMDKIIAYKGLEQDIKADDVIALVSEEPKDQVFKMIDAMSNKNVDLAMQYYFDMLELKVSPQNILRLIERQMRILYQVKDLRSKGFATSAIADSIKEIKKKQYFANKYVSQAGKFSMKEICDCLEDCVDLNLKSRTGALTDRMAVELIIVKYSKAVEKK